MAPLVWLVTGCSSGFGEAFVHEILTRGDKVIATARNGESRLSALKEAGAAVLDLDVTASQDVLDAKLQEAIKIYGQIDVLINNAGFVLGGLVEDASLELWMEQLNTNLFGAMNVTRALLPHFRSRRSGKIAFTNSIYSHIADPCVGMYVVGKHALSGYVAALNKEVSQFGIHAISFDIGHFRTAVTSPAKMKIQLTTIKDYDPMVQGLLAAAGSMDGYQPGDVQKGVQCMVDVLKQEGLAKGKEIPERMPLGADAIEIVRQSCQAMLKTCDEWEALISSTDRDGPKEGAWAENGGYVH